MGALLERLLQMSFAASWALLVVLLARLALARAPRRAVYWLWLAPLVRLLCPLAPLATWSLMPRGGPLATLLTAAEPLPSAPVYPALPALLDGAGDAAAGPEGLAESALGLFDALGWVWLAGFAALVIACAVQALCLRGRLRRSTPAQGNVRLSDSVRVPFVFGVARPRSYLPSHIGARERALVEAHEREHIRRGDPILKALFFGAACLHWFNPLVWVALRLFSRDMELACDEGVLRRLGTQARCDYAQALLSYTAPPMRGAVTGFGAGKLKQRIQNALQCRKTAFGVRLCAAVAVAVLAVCLLFDPPMQSLLSALPLHGYATRAQTGAERGVGFVAERGAPVCAARSGMVLASGYAEDYGNYILLDHGGGLRTFYAQNEQKLVQSGDVVECGRTIATVGNSGAATAPVLYFAVQVNGAWVDPRSALPPFDA